MSTCPYLHVCLLGTFASVAMNACIILCTEVTTILEQGATYNIVTLGKTLIQLQKDNKITFEKVRLFHVFDQ